MAGRLRDVQDLATIPDMPHHHALHMCRTGFWTACRQDGQQVAVGLYTQWPGQDFRVTVNHDEGLGIPGRALQTQIRPRQVVGVKPCGQAKIDGFQRTASRCVRPGLGQSVHVGSVCAGDSHLVSDSLSSMKFFACTHKGSAIPMSHAQPRKCLPGRPGHLDISVQDAPCMALSERTQNRPHVGGSLHPAVMLSA